MFKISGDTVTFTIIPKQRSFCFIKPLKISISVGKLFPCEIGQCNSVCLRTQPVAIDLFKGFHCIV